MKRIGEAMGGELLDLARTEAKPDLGYSSRPFVLCGLPLRRPKSLIHIRRNGDFFLRISGDGELGLPFGQDRLIPLFISTLAIKQQSRTVHFASAAEMLDAFGLSKDGRTYRRLVDGFRRVFSATIFFGTEQQLKAGAVFDWSRFHFFDRIQIWFNKDTAQKSLPGDLGNVVVLSDAFWKELQEHPIPVDMNAVRAFVSSPGALDLYTWLVWRCWKARGVEQVPIFGVGGLADQLGVEGGGSPSRLRQMLRQWIAKIREQWPTCPASISEDGAYLVLRHQKAIR